MDGRDSSGRTISLLNSSAASSSGDWKRFPYYSPSLSPAQTPPTLSRSSSSSDARHLAPISPLTPSDTNHALDSVFRAHKHPTQQYFLARPSQGKMDDQHASMYPPIPDATGAMTSAYPMPAQIAQQLPPQAQAPPQSLYRSSTSPSSEPSRVSTVSATSNAKSQPKKNSYPCPMAKQYGCTDHFTTSGHAARHAKKHTGKKDAFCPECNKAFTRKDNMEQHRRTHQNGRGNPRTAGSTASDDGAKVKKSTKQPPAKKIKAEPQVFEAAVEQQLAEQPPQVAPMV
ncbi:MAG: C2H2-type zinc finger protein, partial [Rhodospirillales bacterium]|nr:C2H2-type zinc finger protein [Acetobacter sp.]